MARGSPQHKNLEQLAGRKPTRATPSTRPPLLRSMDDSSECRLCCVYAHALQRLSQLSASSLPLLCISAPDNHGARAAELLYTSDTNDASCSDVHDEETSIGVKTFPHLPDDLADHRRVAAPWPQDALQVEAAAGACGGEPSQDRCPGMATAFRPMLNFRRSCATATSSGPPLNPMATAPPRSEVLLSRRTFKFFVFLSCYYAVTGWLMRWYFDCSSAAEAQSCRDAVDLQHKCICCTMALLVAVGTIAVDHASKPKNAPLPLTAKSPQRGSMRSPRTHRCY